MWTQRSLHATVNHGNRRSRRFFGPFRAIQTHVGPVSFATTLAWFAAKRPLGHQEAVEIEASCRRGYGNINPFVFLPRRWPAPRSDRPPVQFRGGTLHRSSGLIDHGRRSHAECAVRPFRQARVDPVAKIQWPVAHSSRDCRPRQLAPIAVAQAFRWVTRCKSGACAGRVAVEDVRRIGKESHPPSFGGENPPRRAVALVFTSQRFAGHLRPAMMRNYFGALCLGRVAPRPPL